MQTGIIPQNPMQELLELDRIMSRLLMEREHEWRNERGIRRFIIRIKLEIWALKQAERELESKGESTTHIASIEAGHWISKVIQKLDSDSHKARSSGCLPKHYYCSG
jgi:hypothetical protein